MLERNIDGGVLKLLDNILTSFDPTIFDKCRVCPNLAENLDGSDSKEAFKDVMGLEIIYQADKFKVQNKMQCVYSIRLYI